MDDDETFMMLVPMAHLTKSHGWTETVKTKYIHGTKYQVIVCRTRRVRDYYTCLNKNNDDTITATTYDSSQNKKTLAVPYSDIGHEVSCDVRTRSMYVCLSLPEELVVVGVGPVLGALHVARSSSAAAVESLVAEAGPAPPVFVVVGGRPVLGEGGLGKHHQHHQRHCSRDLSSSGDTPATRRLGKPPHPHSCMVVAAGDLSAGVLVRFFIPRQLFGRDGRDREPASGSR